VTSDGTAAADGSDDDVPTAGPDDDVLALAELVFDLARDGAAMELARYVDAGVPVNLTDAKGNTLLMLASYCGRDAAVTALLERGADPNRINDRGQTPLAGAVFKQAPAVCSALLSYGADPDLGSPNARATAAFYGLDVDLG
jgi:ankyrin repeat protein